MWTRANLKQNARKNLQGKYWMAFAVTLIAGILGGSLSWFSSGSGYRFGREDNGFNLPDWNLLPIFGLLLLLAGIFGLAFMIFVTYPVQAGSFRWFSRSRESAAVPSIGTMFSLFSASGYLGAIGGMLWMNFLLALWWLLALVPTAVQGFLLFFPAFREYGTDLPASPNIDELLGWLTRSNTANLLLSVLMVVVSLLLTLPFIIKSYSYRLTPWILADNPGIGFRRAIRLSMALTRGHKWNIFVLDLSFLGWVLLGLLACGVGVLFVQPYIYATQAELYAVLRQKGVLAGDCTMEELGFISAGHTG